MQRSLPTCYSEGCRPSTRIVVTDNVNPVDVAIEFNAVRFGIGKLMFEIDRTDASGNGYLMVSGAKHSILLDTDSLMAGLYAFCRLALPEDSDQEIVIFEYPDLVVTLELGEFVISFGDYRLLMTRTETEALQQSLAGAFSLNREQLDE